MTTEQRLERLERENWWMRRGRAVLLARVACVVVIRRSATLKGARHVK